MSKNSLTPALKALLKAPHARGSAIPAPPRAASDALFDHIKSSAESNGIGHAAWLTLSVSNHDVQCGR